MRAKKSFGQHFLTNEAIARRIADAVPGTGNWGLGIGKEESEKQRVNVLEVGPGKGMLTKYLLEKDINLKVVEADKDMVAYLEEYFPQLHGRIIAGNFLKLDLSALFSGHQFSQFSVASRSLPCSQETPITSHQSPVTDTQFTIIGNFPYNISSQIVFKMVENRALVPQLVGMFQKEMAERIIASPGGKDYGVISVLTQAFYEGKYLFTVGNRNFNPPPRVQSAVIRLWRKEEELGVDEQLFRKVVKQAFSQRRKMLRNTVKPFFSDPAILEEDFFKQRPEVLSVEDFVKLTERIGSVGNHFS